MLHGQIGGFLSSEEAVHIGRRLAKQVDDIVAIRDKCPPAPTMRRCRDLRALVALYRTEKAVSLSQARGFLPPFSAP